MKESTGLEGEQHGVSRSLAKAEESQKERGSSQAALQRHPSEGTPRSEKTNEKLLSRSSTKDLQKPIVSQGNHTELKRVQSALTDRTERSNIKYLPLKRKIIQFVEHPLAQTTMALITIYALYGDDVRAYSAPPSKDYGFTVMNSIAFFMFMCECMLLAFAKPGYFKWGSLEGEPLSWRNAYKLLLIGSFYFWLEVVATASLIFEISWMYETGPTIQVAQGDANGAVGLHGNKAGATRASRAGARAGRVVRVVRMVRLVRLVRLYRFVKEQLDRKHGIIKDHFEEEHKESRVGAMMSDLTTRRVIVGVLLMLICLPLLLLEETDGSALFDLSVVHDFAVHAFLRHNMTMDSFEFALNQFTSMTPGILNVTNNGTLVYERYCNPRRPYELLVLYVFDSWNGASYDTISFIDNKAVQTQTALYGLLLTTFVIILLVSGSLIFNQDTKRLVIRPIEVMVELVKKINADPIGFDYKVTQHFQEGLETTMLLQTIQKIGGLMRVGFGEAGASIIAKNLKEGTGHKLNLLTAGTKIQSIFGFCDIRNFTDTTECLQSEVMLFVNRIASILHEIVSQCSGAANKNIGDAFLLTWKIEPGWNRMKIAEIADQALYSFILTVAEMELRGEFVCNFSATALQKLYARMPGYKVKMGFGLHYGWAIEGAIGSQRKIDASYISPHVNMAEFLESSTKEYGVGLLMSEAFQKLLSDQAKLLVRKLDRIKRNNAEDPMCLYTFDMEPSNLTAPRGHESSGRRGSLNLKKGIEKVMRRMTIQNAAHQKHHSLQDQKQPHADSLENNGGSKERKQSLSGGRQNDKMQSSPRITDHLTALTTKDKNRFFKGKTRVKPVIYDSAIMEQDGENSQTRTRNGGEKPEPVPSPTSNSREKKPKAAHMPRASSVESIPIKQESKTKAPEYNLPAYTPDIWSTDANIRMMRQHLNDDFRALWAEAIELYIEGDWESANELFNTLSILLPTDKPSQLMIARTRTQRAPHGWPGYREIE